MARQILLPLEGQRPGELWQEFPESCRRETITLYSRLIEKAVRCDTHPERNPTDEPRES